MPIATAAKTFSSDSSHWYFQDGTPCYEVPRSDGQGMRTTTLRDARKLGLLPSVTTILKLLHKQGLVDWLIEQACLSVLTAPRDESEDLDAFVYRVLHTERQQDSEAQKARDLGTDIHAALEAAVQGGQIAEELRVYVEPVLEAVKSIGGVFKVEAILVGDGYAGKTDLILVNGDNLTVIDFKTTKKLPKACWDEHRLQLSAYAAALLKAASHQIFTANIYISTTEPGKFVTCMAHDWQDTYDSGFRPLVEHWQWSNNYNPTNKE